MQLLCIFTCVKVCKCDPVIVLLPKDVSKIKIRSMIVALKIEHF